MRNNRQAVLGIGVVLLIAFCGWIIIRSQKIVPWQSSPTALRKNSIYDEVMKPAAPVKIGNFAWSDIALDTNSGKVKFSIKAEHQARTAGHYAVEKVLMRPGEAVQLGTNLLSLAYIAVAYGPLNYNSINEYEQRFPWRVFTQDLKPMPAQEVAAHFPHQYDKEGGFRGIFPEVRLAFKFSGGPSKLMDSWIFDGRTHASLSSGRTTSSSGDSFYYETDVALWRPAPVEVVLDVAYDPGEPVRLPCQSGASYRTDTVALKLAGLIPGRSSSWSNSSDGKTNTFSVSIGTTPGQTNTTAIFVAHPKASPLPFEIEFIGKNGKPLGGNGGGSSDNILVQGFDGFPEDCAEIVIKPYRKTKRIILQLSELPGLPEENRAVENLFRVRIPYLKVSSQWEMDTTISRLVQMNISAMGPSPTIPSGIYPRLWTNATAADLIEYQRQFYPPQTDLIVTAENEKMMWANNNPLNRLKALFTSFFHK
jgi:hypothetical protein